MTASAADNKFRLDLRPAAAALELQSAHREDFQRLLKLLGVAPGFQLLFARIGNLFYRDSLIAKLDESLAASGRTLCRIDLSDRQTFPDFAALEARLEDDDCRKAVIHLLNADHWLQDDKLEAFNLRRNALAEHIDAALLWWMFPKGIERVALHAPDAWSWRSGVFDFVGEELPSAVPAVRKATMPRQSLSLAQRTERLAVIKGQLMQDVPDDLKLGLLLEQAELLESVGQWSDAERTLLEQALPLADKLGDARSKAVTQGQIADILMARGELDEALRIRTEEELPIYERLGDVRAKAVTLGQIADILMMRGELDAALRIRTEEELPVYERLGDVREKAVTRGKIADILMARGQLEEALRIRTEEELPVYERLGDARAKAATQGGIARILMERGQLEEARAVLDEAVAALRKLGDEAHMQQLLRAAITDADR